MDWNRIEGNWKHYQPVIRAQWTKLTDQQLDVIAGRREQLADQIQSSYAITKKEAGKQLYDWQKVLKDVAAPVA
jgi:uncharacterized protein YjbJ (UPF0337 family)